MNSFMLIIYCSTLKWLKHNRTHSETLFRGHSINIKDKLVHELLSSSTVSIATWLQRIYLFLHIGNFRMCNKYHIFTHRHVCSHTTNPLCTYSFSQSNKKGWCLIIQTDWINSPHQMPQWPLYAFLNLRAFSVYVYCKYTGKESII